MVQKIIDFTGLSSNATITTKYDDVTLYEALRLHHFEITVLNRKVLEDYNELALSSELKKLIKDDKLEEYLYGRFIGFVARFSNKNLQQIN